jgi:hypothetical protein
MEARKRETIAGAYQALVGQNAKADKRDRRSKDHARQDVR